MRLLLSLRGARGRAWQLSWLPPLLGTIPLLFLLLEGGQLLKGGEGGRLWERGKSVRQSQPSFFDISAWAASALMLIVLGLSTT